MKKALIVGSSGQDGSYLAEYLAARTYVLGGISRRGVRGPLINCGPIDICNISEVRRVVSDFAPDEIYFLAAFHHSSEAVPLNEHDLVMRSFEVNTFALHNFLEAVSHEIPHCRLFYAASSHIFGEPTDSFQDEQTPLNPSCVYGISKAASVQLCRYYRQRHKVFSSVGILYNHESPRRPPTFVFRKVIKAAVAISKNRQEKLILGNLDACVDWGYAPDYVEAMWRILQLQSPGDFVVSSGELHSVRDVVEIAFKTVGLNWRAYVEVNPAITRKSPSGVLRGDSSKLRSCTGWRVRKPFHEMIEEIVKVETENEK